MFNNVNAKKRLTQVIVAFVIICMAFTGSFLLLDGFIREVSAVEKDVSVNSKADWDNAMNSANSGDILNVTLGADIISSDTGYDGDGCDDPGDALSNATASEKFAAVPDGVTVFLDMNNHNIIWESLYQGFNKNVIADSYDSGSYKDGYHWGFIENNGILSIQGTGVIRNQKIVVNYSGDERDNCVQRLATIVNNGTLTLSSGLTVDSYISYAHEHDKSYSDAYLYNSAIYNTGTVTSSAKINAASLTGTAQGSKNGRAYAFVYGIYGGTVNVIGGSIYVDSFAGAIKAKNGKKELHAYASAVGVYSNSAVITGNTTINVLAKNWREVGSDSEANDWGDGYDQLFSAGVLYKTNKDNTNENAPVVGPSVDIVASFEHVGDGSVNIYIPGVGIPENYAWSGAYSKTEAKTSQHVASAVAGVTAVQYAIGNHFDGEKENNNNFFGNASPIDSVIGTKYKTVQSYYSGKNTTVSVDNISHTGNGAAYYSSSIVNGAPGKTNTSSNLTDKRTGKAGDYSPNASGFKKGSQYLVVYRFYKDINNIEAVRFTQDTSKLKNEANISVGGNENATHGIIADESTKIQYVGGGETINPNFYEFKGAYYETVESANSGIVNRLRDISNGEAKTPSNWKGSKNLLTNDGASVSNDKDNTIIIYLDYQKLDPAAVNVVAANKGTGITSSTTTKEFSVPYTGANIIPGEDFDFGIIDTTNSKDITSDYNYLRESNSSKIKVDYEYSPYSDRVNWTDGLPKDVGTYAVKVKVWEDEAASNRQGNTVELKATITAATVTISGPSSKSVVYGSTYADIFDFSAYTAKNKSNAIVNGTWSLEGAKATDVPDVGTYTNLKIVWKPSSSEGKNYGTAEYPVTLAVTQRAVTVKIGAGTSTYGENKFAANDFIKFENLPDADVSKTAEWIANTTFTVEGANGASTFAAGLPVGSYKLKIENTKFGGATNQNYTFSFTEGTLTVQKKDLYYRAESAGKVYDGSKDISVTLRYSSGIFSGDPYENVYLNVPGTMVTANAGENKFEKIDTSRLSVNSNYNLVIGNADTVTVNVEKYTPTAADVAVVANPSVVEYDKAQTLGSITLESTKTDITGTWAWELANTVPHVSQNKYVAVFTPADKTNYNTYKQDVNLTVEKKDVEVTVDAITVTYGDNVPVLTIKYNGFSVGDSLATIDYEGNASASTTYTPGSGVEKKYPISVESTLESENYNFVNKNSEITVAPKTLTVTAANDSIVYGTAAPEYNVSDVTATGFYGSDSLSSLNATVKVTTTYIAGTVTGKVGTYPINVEVTTANKNYNITTVAGTLTVTKAVLTVTPNAKTITFGADVPEYNVAGTDYAVTGFVNGDTLARVTITGAPVFTTPYTSESFVNTYPVTAVVTNMSADNYTFVGASGSIKVVKADPKVSTAPAATVVNSHSLADAKFDNSAVVVNPNDSTVNVPGAFAFVDSAAVPVWGSTNSYEAVFTPDDIINYNTTTVNVTVNVTVKTISGTPVIQGSAMVGSTLTVSLAAMDPTTATSYTYQWYVGDTAVATGSSYTIDEADIGKTIYVVLDAVEANGFTGNATSVATDKVIKALLETTAAQLKVVFNGVEYTGLGVNTEFESVVYDTMPHAGTVAIADGYKANYFGTPVLKYNGSTEAPTAAGTYTVTVDVSTPAEPEGGYPENTYYGPATGIAVGTITIARAPFTVTVKANDKIYDGTVTATAEISGSGLANDEVSLANTARYSFANANAGTNKPITVTNVTLLGKDAGNYKIVVEPATASILPRVIYYRANGVDKFYDGLNTVAVEFIYDSGMNATDIDCGYASVDNASKIYVTGGSAIATDVNAGEGIILTNVQGTPAGESSDNYEIRISNEGAVTVNIKKAPVVLTTPVIEGIVYDSTKPLSTIDLSHLNTSEGYWMFNDATIVPTVKQKAYAATYYSKNSNYEAETAATITVNVTPKTVLLTTDNKSITYGSNAPTYTISASGFTGTDSLAMIGGNISATSTYSIGSDVGSYPITINEQLTRDNYTFEIQQNAGSLTVSPATVNVTATAVNKIYDGSKNVTVNFEIKSGVYAADANNPDAFRLSATTANGIASTQNAGVTKVVSYQAPGREGAKAHNYLLNITPAAGALTVEIFKADIENVEFPSGAKVEFGYDLTHVTFADPGDAKGGSFEYENAKATVPGDLGTYNIYKVIYTPADAVNYNTQEAIVTLQVVECSLNYVIGIAGNLQAGQTLTAVSTGLPAAANSYIHYQWYRVDGKDIEPINGATSRTYVATDKDVGYTLAVMTYFDSTAPFVFADGNYEIVDDIPCVVGQSTDAIKEVALTFWQRIMNWLYRILAILTGLELNGGLGI